MALPVARIVLSLILIGTGVLCWTAASVADDLARRHERIATLQVIDSPSASRWRAYGERLVNVTLGAFSPSQSADYWAGRYEAVWSTSEASNDPAVLLIAANAFFRKAQREAGGRAPAVERLDSATQAYASALKNGGFSQDAAFNYEFVARLRDTAARSKGASPTRQTRLPTARPNDDLPSGATIHGRPGTHPASSRGEDFEVLTPMDYGDREAQPEATPGRPLPRKG
jgi:hypothetical protein